MALGFLPQFFIAYLNNYPEYLAWWVWQRTSDGGQ